MIHLPYADNYSPCIEADFAWDGKEKGCRGYAGVPGYDVDAASHYKSTMTLAEIDYFGRTELLRVAKPSCHFWFWTTDLFLDECLSLISGWGLMRKRTHVWVKTTKTVHRGLKGLENYSRQQVADAAEVCAAMGYPGKPYSRTGHWGKMGHEYLILATNDSSFRTLNAKFEPSVFHAPVPGGEHSAKPPEAYELIRRNSPGPRLSLFQRTERTGFECWGNEMVTL